MCVIFCMCAYVKKFVACVTKKIVLHEKMEWNSCSEIEGS